MQITVTNQMDDDDLDEVRQLLDVARAHDDHEALGEHKRLDLTQEQHGYAAIIARDGDDLVGYGHLSSHAEREHWGLAAVVHPEGRGTGIEQALVERALGIVRERGGGHVHYWVFRPTEIHDAIAQDLALRHGRDLLQMRMPLPPDEDPKLPDDTTLRTFEPGRDEEAWIEVNNRAFDHHPEQGAWTLETLRERMTQDWFDPDGFLLAEDSDGLAGFCWTKIHAHEGLGEIYVIGVDPSRQGRGLGRALSLAGLHSLHDRGAPTGSLYVDSSNEAAVAMYRSIGFTVHHLDRAYVVDV